MNEISNRVRDLTPRLVALRRDLHQHPEIAFEEVRTSAIVADRLRELGLEPRTGLGTTGVVAVWDSGRPGPTVLARADMDALPVPEEKSVEYRSTVEGKMHACGHDGHTAVLLSVAEVVTGMADQLSGRVVFVFQPAEEIVRGASAMLADGALDGIDVDHVIGLHLSSEHEVGTVALRAGPSMAATDSFRMVVRGHGGHAAYPHQNVDPVLASAHLVLALQSLVSRETDPIDNSVISLTSVHGGTAYNIIPEEVELKGTLRTFNADTRRRLTQRIREVASGVSTTLRCTVDIEWFEGTPAVVNDEAETDLVARVAGTAQGVSEVKRSAQAMGGDDMALWLQQAKGAYFYVGARGGDETAYPHHHPRFDIDERSLPIAAEVLASGVVELLAGQD